MTYKAKVYLAIILCFIPVPVALVVLTSGIIQIVGILIVFNMGYLLSSILNSESK